MSDPLIGSHSSMMRRLAITNVSIIWDLCKDEIERLQEELNTEIEDLAKEKMEQSITVLNQVVTSLNVGDYVKDEIPDVFNQLIKRLNGSFKLLLFAYILPNEITYRSDNIEDLTKAFFGSIQRKLGQDKLCNYAGVTKLVKFVRNHVEHDCANEPEDLITGERSFGNVYTLTSILILSFYAYIEILKFWIKAEQV